MTEKILQYIKDNWKRTIRENTQDRGDLLGLPYPYTVPCIKDAFQEMYYWDTYFTSKALITLGEVEQAKNNCNNFIHEVNRFGFILNGSRTYYLNRSQPPYMTMLVKEIYESVKNCRGQKSKNENNHTEKNVYDKNNSDWLKKAVPAIEKEYDFWMTERISPVGLNHYGFKADEDYILDFYETVCKPRLFMNHKTIAEKLLESSHTIAEAESGWDFNPRFNRKCMNFAPIDLNCNLYFYESVLALFYEKLGYGNSQKWLIKAEKRKELINKYCWNEERGVFMDYDFISNKQSKVLSAASLHPLLVKLASKEQADSTVKAMKKYLETDYGILTCEKYKNPHNCLYQWDYPLGWPPLQMIAFQALENYSYINDTCRIAEKYISLVAKCFNETGDLWEKYNLIEGSCDVNAEYEMPAMMGWTAGAFIEAYYLLKKYR